MSVYLSVDADSPIELRVLNWGVSSGQHGRSVRVPNFS